MELLKQRILEDGRIEEGNILKVDNFLNHQLDINLLTEVGKEFTRLFADLGITKILTIEASGIAIASLTALQMDVPVVFAKKTQSKNLDNETWDAKVHSYTKGITYTIKVSKRYLSESDKVLIIDDFLANGQACLGLKEIVENSGAELKGVGIVIEKSFQQGAKMLKDAGINLHSLARIASIEDGSIDFVE
ncbi:xanthine phosphoribosyltransferase [Puteibacter caeruleilacunae]|nr:xanthine phosphoribosyltransferase [Puteibacter caeruleilacunae]